MMKNFSPLLLVILLSSWSCSEEETAASCSEQPLEELTWLQKAIKEMESDQYAYIMQAEYESETVFVYGYCCPACNYVVPVKNCEGELLGNVGDEIEVGKLKEQEMIWQSANSSCYFPR